MVKRRVWDVVMNTTCRDARKSAHFLVAHPSSVSKRRLCLRSTYWRIALILSSSVSSAPVAKISKRSMKSSSSSGSPVNVFGASFEPSTGIAVSPVFLVDIFCFENLDKSKWSGMGIDIGLIGMGICERREIDLVWFELRSWIGGIGNKNDGFPEGDVDCSVAR